MECRFKLFANGLAVWFCKVIGLTLIPKSFAIEVILSFCSVVITGGSEFIYSFIAAFVASRPSFVPVYAQIPFLSVTPVYLEFSEIKYGIDLAVLPFENLFRTLRCKTLNK